MTQIRKKTYDDLKKYLVFLCTIFLILISSATVQALPDEYEDDNSCESANFINVNGDHQIHNFYDNNDEDWFMFYGVAGKKYKIVIANVGINADPRIELYDSDCTTSLKDVWDINFEGKGEEMDWTECGRDGIYHIKISSCGGSCIYDESTGYEIYVYEPNAPSTTGEIEGKLVDASEKPISGAIVSTSERAFFTDSEGIFNLNTHKPGTFTLTIKYTSCDEKIIPDVVVNSLQITNVGQIEIQPSVTCNNKGDINQDGAVLLDDIKLAFSYLVFPPKTCNEICLANLDNDGNFGRNPITIQDVKEVFNIFIGE